MSSYPVHQAAQHNQFSEIQSLLNQDTKQVNTADEDGRTPLHWAASASSGPKSMDGESLNLIITRLLLDHKAELEIGDAMGDTPLLIAVRAGNKDIVKALIAAGADVRKPNIKGLTPLHAAASKSARTDSGSSKPTESAVHIEIGELLIDKGADINALDKANQHPMHRAASVGSIKFVALLLKPRAGFPKTRLNNRDRIGNTPLHLAMDSAHASIAVLLIQAGADRGRLNENQEEPEEVEGVGGSTQKNARLYVIECCGKQ